MSKVNGKLPQLNPNRTNKGLDFSGMNVLFVPPGKELLKAEALAYAKAI